MGTLIPRIIGIVIMVLTVGNQVFVEQGMPKTGSEWGGFLIALLTGVGVAYSKQFNVSNSGTNAAPHKVKTP